MFSRRITCSSLQPVGVVLPELFCDIIYGRRWWIPLLLAVLANLPRHSHREEPLGPGEGPAHLPGQGAGLPPCHPAAGTQFNWMAALGLRLREWLGLPVSQLVGITKLVCLYCFAHLTFSGSTDTLKTQNGSKAKPCLIIILSSGQSCRNRMNPLGVL